MKPEDRKTNGEFYAALSLLKNLQDETPDLLTLISKVEKATSSEEKLAAYKEIRDGNFWPAEASFFLISTIIMQMADKRIGEQQETTFKLQNKRLDAVRKAHGREEEGWPPGKGPKEYRILVNEWEKTADGITADTFRECGEQLLADLFLNNQAEFDRLYQAGRAFFHK